MSKTNHDTDSKFLWQSTRRFIINMMMRIETRSTTGVWVYLQDDSSVFTKNQICVYLHNRAFKIRYPNTKVPRSMGTCNIGSWKIDACDPAQTNWVLRFQVCGSDNRVPKLLNLYTILNKNLWKYVNGLGMPRIF